MIAAPLREPLREAIAAIARWPLTRGTIRPLALRGWVPQAVWQRLPVEAVFDVDAADLQFAYCSERRDDIGRYLYWTGLSCYERETLDVFLPLARRARRFVDVGANTGLFTLIACAARQDLAAVAFEPVPRVFERLRRNVELNGFASRCRLRAQAVAAFPGRSQLHVPRREVPKSASLDRSGFRGMAGDLIDVETTTIDQVRDDLGPIDLIKLDVEGFEHEVLAGMSATLERDRPLIILECHPDGPTDAIARILTPQGYIFHHCRPDGLHRCPGLQSKGGPTYPNWLCVPRERLAELERLEPGRRASAAA